MDKELINLNITTNGSHFFHLYKNEGKINDYREKMKEDIKSHRDQKRQKNFDINRAIESSKEDEKIVNNCFYQQGKKSKSKWCDVMMLAEWFLLVPEGFDEEYLMKFCPVGKHVLVVSSKNKTFIYNKRGRMLSCIQTDLPGGGNNCGGSAKSAVLDCIFDEENKIFYVLDIISYLRQDFQLMTAKCRFNWLENFLIHIFNGSDLCVELDGKDKYRFEVLPSIACDKHSIASSLSLATPFQIDGLLFYWCEGVYVGGSTYCATWLKPYMVPELLGIEVHADLMANMPMDYEDYRADIIRYNKQYGFTFDQDKTTDKSEVSGTGIME